MENKCNSRWKFYHKKLPIKLGENFIINTTIELISDLGYGQYGFVWGFDKPHEILNRFTVSVESTRYSVCKFEKIITRFFIDKLETLKKNMMQRINNSFQ